MNRFRYDRDLDCLVEIGNNYYDDRPRGPQIIRDIQPYRTIASDIAANGKRVVIGGRRQHREFLRRNQYVEVGNDYDKKQVLEGKPRQYTLSERRAIRERRIEDIKRAIETCRRGEGYKPSSGDYE